MTISEQIDTILEESRNGEAIFIHSDLSELYIQAVQMAEAYNLIMKQGRGYVLTQLGYEVAEAGSFDHWRSSIKKREDEAHQATLDTARATVDAARSAKQSKVAAWFAGAVGAIAVGLTGFQIWKSNEVETEKELLQKRLVKIDSLVNVLSRNQRLPSPQKVTK